MTGKSENIVRVTPEMAQAALKEVMDPEFLAWFDALTDEDIEAQIASGPDWPPARSPEWRAWADRWHAERRAAAAARADAGPARADAAE